MQPLSPRQRRCLEAVLAHRRKTGLPPTYRELGRALGIASTNGVRRHLEALERKGYLRMRRAARGLELAEEVEGAAGIPILGRIAAGRPIEALENFEGAVDVGSLCAFPVDSRERPDGAQWCNAQIVCGGELLYGGPTGGDFPCELLDAPRPGVRGEDDATHATDDDAAMRLDSEAETLEVWDDETGDYGAFRVAATVEAVDVLPAAAQRGASPRHSP